MSPLQNNWTILVFSADMNSSLSNGLVTLRANAIYKVPLKSSLIRLSVTQLETLTLHACNMNAPAPMMKQLDASAINPMPFLVDSQQYQQVLQKYFFHHNPPGLTPPGLPVSP
jgi:hypothetical protein